MTTKPNPSGFLRLLIGYISIAFSSETLFPVARPRRKTVFFKRFYSVHESFLYSEDERFNTFVNDQLGMRGEFGVFNKNKALSKSLNSSEERSMLQISFSGFLRADL